MRPYTSEFFLALDSNSSIYSSVYSRSITQNIGIIFQMAHTALNDEEIQEYFDTPGLFIDSLYFFSSHFLRRGT